MKNIFQKMLDKKKFLWYNKDRNERDGDVPMDNSLRCPYCRTEFVKSSCKYMETDKSNEMILIRYEHYCEKCCRTHLVEDVYALTCTDVL